MSVVPITPQEIDPAFCPSKIPDEICEIINELLNNWFVTQGQSEARINILKDIKEKAFQSYADDKEKTCLLYRFFDQENWCLRVKSYYEAAGWKVRLDYLIEKTLPRFVFSVP